jgi:phospholipid-binding lipoprotein MlaA
MNALRGISVAFLGIWLSACSTMGGNDATNDPFEATNRQVFAFDEKVDRNILLPTAAFYVQVVPGPVRDSVHNFLANLDDPIIFANDILQGETKRGAQTMGRFVINTTAGVGGLFDVAAKAGVPQHGEDFGQTLAVWGVPEGPYMVLPFLGPDPPRDSAGQLVDYLFDPTTYLRYKQHIWWSAGRETIHVIDIRARNAAIVQGIERGSVDYYASVRSLYRQHRQSEIDNGKTNTNNLPNF